MTLSEIGKRKVFGVRGREREREKGVGYVYRTYTRYTLIKPSIEPGSEQSELI